MEQQHTISLDIQNIRSFGFFISAKKNEEIISIMQKHKHIILQNYKSLNCDFDVVFIPFTNFVNILNKIENFSYFDFIEKIKIKNLITEQYADYQYKYYLDSEPQIIYPEQVNITTYIKDKKNNIKKYFQIVSVYQNEELNVSHSNIILEKEDVLNKFMSCPLLYFLK